MNQAVRALFCLLVGVSASAKKIDVPVDPGPPPSSFEDYKRLAETSLLQSFFDPSSAQIQWDRGVVGGYWKPPFERKVAGWFTCGLVNGRNRMGGYVGFRRFVVVEREGTVVFSAVSTGDNIDFIDLGCQKAISSGVLSVAAISSTTSPPPAQQSDPNAGRFGFAIKIVPAGLAIAAIEKDSAADKAGLKVGMIISHINGIPLAGFDELTIIKMLKAVAGETSFRVIGREEIKVTKPSNAIAA